MLFHSSLMQDDKGGNFCCGCYSIRSILAVVSTIMRSSNDRKYWQQGEEKMSSGWNSFGKISNGSKKGDRWELDDGSAFSRGKEEEVRVDLA